MSSRFRPGGKKTWRMIDKQAHEIHVTTHIPQCTGKPVWIDVMINPEAHLVHTMLRAAAFEMVLDTKGERAPIIGFH